MWAVARTSKERKRKSSGTKTAWVFSYEPFANEAIANLDGIAALPAEDDEIHRRTAECRALVRDQVF